MSEAPLILRRAEGVVSFLYRMARSDIAGVWRAGWRPALGFAGVYVALFAFVIAPSKGIAIDAGATNIFLAMVFLQALGRGVEKTVAGMNLPPVPTGRTADAPRGGAVG